MKIAFCMMQSNMYKNCMDRVNEITGLVDRIIIVDGGSVDDSILYFRNRKDTEIYVHAWQDRWPKQRNYYIQHASESPRADWIIAVDPDEQLKPLVRKNARAMMEWADSKGLNAILIRPHDISMMGEEIVYENDAKDFRKTMMYKNVDGVQYVGTVHEGMSMPGGWRGIFIEDVVTNMAKEGLLEGEDANPEHYRYNHIKQEGITHIRDIHYFTAGGGGNQMGDRNPHFIEFKKALEADGTPRDSQIVKDLMVRGEIGPNLIQWIIDHKDIREIICDGNESGCSEMRAFFVTLFELWHPELKEKYDVK